MVTNNDRSPRTKASFEKSEHNEGKKRKEKKKRPFPREQAHRHLFHFLILAIIIVWPKKTYSPWLTTNKEYNLGSLKSHQMRF